MNRNEIWYIGIAVILSVLVFAATSNNAYKYPFSPENVIMQKWAEALGGFEASTRIDSLHLKKVVTLGEFKDTLEQWYSAKEVYRESWSIADVVNESIVFDRVSGQGWILDSNEQLQPLQGETLKETITGFYFDSFWHFPMSLSFQGKVQVLEKNEESTIISLAPHNGSTVVVYLDSKTNRPQKVQNSSYEPTWTTVYHNWRQVKGLWWPYQKTLIDQSGEAVANFQIVSMEANIKLQDDLFQLSEPSHESRIVFRDNAESTKIHLTRVGNQLFLQVRVNESELLLFGLDSGSATTYIDSRQIDNLGLNTQGSLKVRGYGEGFSNAAFIGDIALTLPDLTLHNIKAIAIDFQSMPVGLLGGDLFSQLRTTLDYENETLIIHNGVSIDKDSNSIELPLMIDRNLAYANARVTLGGKSIEGKFIIDTGAGFSLLLNTPFVESHKLLDYASAVTEPAFSVQGVGGKSASQIARAKEVSLGEIKFEDPIIYLSRDQAGGAASSKFAGFIGGELLRRLTLTFDYENQTLELKPNGNFHDPFYYDLGGMVLENPFRVSRVLTGSPADKAGIKKGDLILSVDQHPVYDTTIDELYLRYSGSNNIHAVEVLQGRERKVFHLSLQPLI